MKRAAFLASLILLFFLITASVLLAQGPAVRITNHTPGFIANAQDLGSENPAQLVNVTVWLQLRHEDALDRLLQQLYDPSSALYGQWLSLEEFNRDYAPTADQVAVVRNFLAAQNLKVLSTGENNAYVQAQGTVANLQKALNVHIHRFNRNGRNYRANIDDPAIAGPAAALIASIRGLHNFGMNPHSMRPKDPEGRPLAMVPLAQAPNGLFFSGQCFRPPEMQTFTTNGGLPKATYVGNRYGQDITNSDVGTWPPCGYQPSDLWTAYDLNRLYKKGLDGTGQTVVIVDAYGSTTIQADAETFSQVYGLPDVTAANLQIVGTPVPATTSDIAGWAGETTLDVEWVHAIAPGAKIALMVAPTNQDSDLAAAILAAVTQRLGNVISNSWGGPESQEDAAGFKAFETTLKLAAARGIAVNFSTGDDGDFSDVLGAGVTDVSYPASSPLATGIGGTSLALDKHNNILFQTGWGNNLTEIADKQSLGTPPVVPPNNEGFVFGSGGGASAVFGKPFFQRGLRGRTRLLPDISWLADPYTGVEFIQTIDDAGDQGVSVIGGTSLSCPMFSALWAIANQKARHPLGQAAPYVYGLPNDAVTDVAPVFSRYDVSGTILTTKGFQFESPWQLAAPLDGTNAFVSALYNSPYSTRWFVLTFGTDSSLQTNYGWDNVTGVGTPDGEEFVEAVAQPRRF